MNKLAILGAAVLGLCANASAQATDYTPVTINLTATYTVTTPGYWGATNVWNKSRSKYVYTSVWVDDPVTSPRAAAINNASLLAKIGSFLNTNLAKAALAIDNTSGNLCVVQGTNLVFDLGTSPNVTNSYVYIDENDAIQTNDVTYKVSAKVGAIFPRFNATPVITSGTSSTNGNYSVGGTIATEGFNLTFSDSDNEGTEGTDYQVSISGGLGTFTSILTGTQTYKQSLNEKVFGTFTDTVNGIDGNGGFISGTITAAGGPSSQVAVPSIWDVINPAIEASAVTTLK